MWATILSGLASLLAALVKAFREPTLAREAEKAGAAEAAAQAGEVVHSQVRAALEARDVSDRDSDLAAPVGVDPGGLPAPAGGMPDDGFRRD